MVKIGVISDTHGNKKSLLRIYEALKEVQLILHLGDHWQDALWLEKNWGLPTLAVRGNCDEGNAPGELLLSLYGKKFFLTHGHTYGVKLGLQRLYYRALEVEAEYCLFGHSHVPCHEKIEGVTFLNPGSLTYPRGLSAYLGIVLEIDGQGEKIDFLKA